MRYQRKTGGSKFKIGQHSYNELICTHYIVYWYWVQNIKLKLHVRLNLYNYIYI